MLRAEQDALAGGFQKWCRPQDQQLVSRNLDEVAAILQRKIGPQRYEIQGRSKPFVARMQFRQLDHLALGYAWFSPAIKILSTPAEPYYSLFFRRYGSSEYRVGRRTFVTSPSCGALLPGMQPLQVQTQENWHVFGTRFSPDAIQLELSHLLGREIVRPVEFDPMVDYDRGAGRIIRQTLERLYKEAGRAELELTGSAFRLRQIQRSLITLMLEGLRHNYSRLVNGPARDVAPWQVRAVEEFIAENAEQPLSLGDFAVISGVSARTLQYAFCRHRGCSPMEFLRRIRFERVRNELIYATDDATVTAVATRWGFVHLGRFATQYRIRFRESPSETLRRPR